MSMNKRAGVALAMAMRKRAGIGGTALKAGGNAAGFVMDKLKAGLGLAERGAKAGLSAAGNATEKGLYHAGRATAWGVDAAKRGGKATLDGIQSGAGKVKAFAGNQVQKIPAAARAAAVPGAIGATGLGVGYSAGHGAGAEAGAAGAANNWQMQNQDRLNTGLGGAALGALLGGGLNYLRDEDVASGALAGAGMGGMAGAMSPELKQIYAKYAPQLLSNIGLGGGQQ